LKCGCRETDFILPAGFDAGFIDQVRRKSKIPTGLFHWPHGSQKIFDLLK